MQATAFLWACYLVGERAAKGVIPANTEFNTKWAVKNFLYLDKQWTECLPDNPVTSDILNSEDVDLER